MYDTVAIVQDKIIKVENLCDFSSILRYLKFIPLYTQHAIDYQEIPY